MRHERGPGGPGKLRRRFDDGAGLAVVAAVALGKDGDVVALAHAAYGGQRRIAGRLALEADDGRLQALEQPPAEPAAEDVLGGDEVALVAHGDAEKDGVVVRAVVGNDQTRPADGMDARTEVELQRDEQTAQRFEKIPDEKMQPSALHDALPPLPKNSL